MAPQRRGRRRPLPKGDTPIKAGKAWKTGKNRRILPKGRPHFEPLVEEPGIHTPSQRSRRQTRRNIRGKQKVHFKSPMASVQLITPVQRRTGQLANRSAGDPAPLCEPANQAMAIAETTTQNKNMRVLEKHERPLEGDLPVPDIDTGEDSSSSVTDEELESSSETEDSSSSVCPSSSHPSSCESMASCESMDSSDSLDSDTSLPSPEILLNEDDGESVTRVPQYIPGLPVNSTLLNLSHAENLHMQLRPNVSTILGSPTIPAEKRKRSFFEGTKDQHATCSGLFQADKSLKIKMPMLKLKPIKIKYKKVGVLKSPPEPATTTHAAPEPGNTRPEPGETCPHPGPAQTRPHPGPAKNRPHPEAAKNRPESAQTLPLGPRVFDMSDERLEEFFQYAARRRFPHTVILPTVPGP